LVRSDGVKPESSLGEVFSSSKNSLIADICQSLVIDLFAPAGVLIDQNGDRIHTIGSPHRYLGVAEEYLGRDVLALASPEIRFGIESTIERAKLEDARVVSVPHQVIGRGQALSFRIAARPFLAEGEPLVLVCFIDEPAAGETPSAAGRSTSEIAILRQELSDTRTELRRAIRNLEISSEEHKAITEESVATNEEYQSSNDQLIASKGELKFLNDELMAVNFQLYEIIERQRTSTNDLEDILFSTDIATLFLDADLNIRLFSPSIASFFHILPGDIGRPLADLRSLATDEALLDDVRTTLESRVPIEREIKTDRALWYTRRVSPYRSRANNARGVVLTFSDVTERKHAAFAVESALRQAEEASLSKSRFLSTVSHDLRQPMQTFALIQGLLAKTTLKASEQRLVMKLDQTLQTMLSTVNALIDMSRIDTGSINPEIRAFPIHDLLVAIEQRPASRRPLRAGRKHRRTAPDADGRTSCLERVEDVRAGRGSPGLSSTRGDAEHRDLAKQFEQRRRAGSRPRPGGWTQFRRQAWPGFKS
jgi:two-component system CheB/CheR fusion protein